MVEGVVAGARQRTRRSAPPTDGAGDGGGGDVAGPAHAGGGGGGLTYMPALDGVRALAVLAVMAYHGGLSFLPGGFFGVDAFFVLSGFLITSLLVTEQATTGGIRLRGFWARRARRLLPALLVLIVFVVLYGRYVAAPGMYPGLRGDGIATLFYGANWHFIATGQSYFVQTGPVSPLLHTWSLAIEEQFYILWPLVVFVVARPRRGDPGPGLRRLLGISVVGALLSALEMALLFHPGGDPTRVYFGTDTHAQCLLVGAALACGLRLWHRRGTTVDTRRARWMLSTGAVAGVGVCAWAWSQLQYGQTFVFRGGFLVVSLAVAAVIAGAVLHPAGVVATVLSWAPLRFLGKISYGMYLWHFPLDIAMTAASTGVSGDALFALRTVATIAVSVLSYYGLERPIRSGRLLRAPRVRLVAPLAVVGTAVVIVLGTLAPASGAFAAGAPGSAPATGTTGAGGPPLPARLADAPVRVMVVGDSVADTLAIGLTPEASQWHLTIVNRSILGCGLAQGDFVWIPSGGRLTEEEASYACRTRPAYGDLPWTTAWSDWLQALRPNVVVVLAGRWEVVDRSFLGKRTNILHPGFADYVENQLKRAVAIGTSTGARMVLMTAPCFSEGAQPNGSPWPEDNPRRVAIYNNLVRTVAAQFPTTVTVEDLYSMVCPGGRYTSTLDGRPLRTDGIHFSLTPGTGSALLGPKLLPRWEQLGHEQEEGGGTIDRGPLPTHLAQQ